MITSGPWAFKRSICHLQNGKEERVTGKIRYSRRPQDLDAVIYREDGLYEYAAGKSMEVFREYEYVVPSGNDDETLEIYFVEKDTCSCFRRCFVALRCTA